MHSRIFQLSEVPVNKEDYITEDEFIDGFVGMIADYVSSDTDRREDIQWLCSVLKEYGIIYDENEESIIFLEGFKKKYFKERFEKLRTTLQNMSLEEFSSDSLAAFELASLIENRFSFYVYSEYTWQSLDNFVRSELKEGQKYYIGGTLDYHC
jgi:acyl carrier protein